MTNIFYDSEFIDDGYHIEPISFAMVCENQPPIYWVTNSKITQSRILAHPWLKENVVPSLPLIIDNDSGREIIYPDYRHADIGAIQDTEVLAEMVEEFILAAGPNPQLWADYGAYDHVLMAQLFGPMVNLPEGIPMHTNDFRTLLLLTGAKEDEIPPFTVGHGVNVAHNALFDALELQFRFNWLRQHSSYAHAFDYVQRHTS